MRALANEILEGARLLQALPSYLHEPIGAQRARAVVRGRLERREAAFLAAARETIFGRADGPYRALLALAGCEQGDFERLIEREGLEGGLDELYRRGVYLNVDELKGRRAVVRGSTTLEFEPRRLRNPTMPGQFTVRTGASTGSGTFVPMDLRFIRDIAVNQCLRFEARGGATLQYAYWGVPGGSAVLNVLQPAGFGTIARRWFSQIDPAARTLHPRYRWSGRLIRLSGWLAGVRLPAQEYAPIERPEPIVRWLAEELRAGRRPHLQTQPSPAVRLAEAAIASGQDLSGAQLTVGGEPVTRSRLDQIRRSGATALPGYSSMEAYSIAQACLAPAAPDDMHVFHDLYAIIQPERQGAVHGHPPRGLFFSSLLPTAPVVLLNVSLGDQAFMSQRACGCPAEQEGWRTHLNQIRSYEKLTAGGMTFFDADIVKVLEEVLPARFGGGPTDYQLLEESGRGQARLRLLVRPSVDRIEPAEVEAAFLEAVGSGTGAARVMALQWQQARTIVVELREPIVTAGGKILHLHRAPGEETFGELGEAHGKS